MRVGVFGTGTVGQTLGSRLLEVGHDVVMGARDAANPKAAGWAAEHNARAGTFADAAAHGELLVNATAGTGTLGALASVGAADLAGKVLLDASNPLDFSGGFPPSLSVANTDSLAEQIQRTYPDLRVVKALNTVTADVMVHPARLSGPHDVFMAGDDADARSAVAALLAAFGWPAGSVVDLGGIRAARGMEMYMPLWLNLMGTLGTSIFNIKVVR
jgi:predicted dinucleotide-binding enzyme